MRKPRVHLIATGGTIAGVAREPVDTLDYTAGSLTGVELVASVPPIADIAELTVEQLWNLDSRELTPAHWRSLAEAVDGAMRRDEVDGIVITHGTDTLEESAFFLDLVLAPGKPVVFTGAMRPATALSADGPMILYSAIMLAASEAAAGLGVVAVMNNRIHAARNVRKAHPTALDAFTSGEPGALGSVPPVQIHRRPPPSAGKLALAALPQHRAAPRVDLLWVGAGSDPALLGASLDSGAQGVVLALPGNCSLPQAWVAAVDAAVTREVPVLLASRTGEAVTVALRGSWQPALLREAWLTPVQARVALIAALWARGA